MFRILIIDASSRLKTMSEDFWRRTDYRVEFVQVNTMQDVIGIAAKAVFWYIDINADSVDYIPKLPILRANTGRPITLRDADEAAAQMFESLVTDKPKDDKEQA